MEAEAKLAKVGWKSRKTKLKTVFGHKSLPCLATWQELITLNLDK